MCASPAFCAPAHLSVRAPGKRTDTCKRTRRHGVRACLRTNLYELATGTTMEVITAEPEKPIATNPPLLLIPGSYHAAWCWENFQRLFASRGYTSHAVSLRGSGSSENPKKQSKVYLSDHLADLSSLFTKLDLVSPVIMGHSTGGLLVQQWSATLPLVTGGVLLASKPPVDHNGLIWRTMRKYGVQNFWRVTAAFVFKTLMSDISVCRDVLFSRTDASGFDESCEGDAKLLEYMKQFATSKIPTDLKSTQVAVTDPGALRYKTLVMHAEDDRIVDMVAAQESTDFFDAELKVVPGPHDIMLASHWKIAAEQIVQWLDNFNYECEQPASTVQKESTAQ